MDGACARVDEARLDRVESLDLEGRGVIRHEGKLAFVEGALPLETVLWQCTRRGSKFDLGRVTQVQRASSARVAPRCPHFGLHRGACGGCSMQHLEVRAQVSIKQRVLEDALWHLGRLRPEQVLRPICGVPWAYRHRARLSVRYVARRGEALVGFHERASSFVADIHECHVLAAPVGRLLDPLRALVTGLSVRQRLPQIEVAAVSGGAGGRRVLTVLVFRILEDLGESDRAALTRFGCEHRVSIWIQRSGPASARPLNASDQAELVLALPEFSVSIPFAPTDFTQVNHAVNEVLVRRALALLQVAPGERVLDLFSGLGNFTLPLATQAQRALGIEGNAAQVARAAANAAANGLAGRAGFLQQDLFAWTEADWQALNQREGPIDRVLLDPPREGALAVARALAASRLHPRRLVYVSCNPATLARDCAVLLHEGGWRLSGAGVLNMFPHTSHVESIALLEPPAH